nr:hypothetical protein [Tanacetum cinerariifolium]
MVTSVKNALLHQAAIEAFRNLVLAAGDPSPTSSIPAGSIDSAEFGVPAASGSAHAVFTNDPAATSPLPPGHSLGSCKHTTRFPSLSDLGNHQPTAGIFSSSSYDADFCANVTNLASTVAVDPLVTKRVNTIHPQSQIIGALHSPVQTRSTMQKSNFGESAFISYVRNQNRTNHADHLHCLFACFLSQLKPSSVIAIGTKWILKNKRDARGIVVRNKAKLVAQGHRQEDGIDYDEVFALVARIEAIRLFLAFASYMGFMVYQIDVKSAFLYREIEEEVYVTQPKGVEDPYNPKHIYRVIKALYRLHQAPRAWYARLSTFLLKHHYRKAWCDEFEVLMKGKFKMSAMGELTFFLGLQVKQLPDGIFINQDKYVKDMLKKFDMESVRTVTTSYEVLKHKSKDDPHDVVNVYLFRSMIGSLMYLTASRPDIMFAVSACSRHQLEAYNDSDYAGSHGDRKYITGGCQFLGRRLISWQCKKQTVISLSGSLHWDAQSLVSCGVLLYADHSVNRSPMLLVVLVHADVKQFWATATVHTHEAGPSHIIANIDGNEVVVTESLIRTQLQLNDVDGLYEFPLTDVLDKMRVIGEPSPVREPTPVREPSPVREPTPRPVQKPTPDSPRPPSPPPRSKEVGPTTSTRPPSPTGQSSFHEDISEGGGDFVSLPKSNEAPLTLAATAAGGAEDSAALTALSIKLDRCINRVTSLENELGVTKKVLGGAVLKLVTRGEDATLTEQDIDLEALHTLASTSLGGDSTDKVAGHDAAEVPADATMPFYSTSTTRRRLEKPFTSSTSAHVPDNIPAGAGILAAATTIPAGSSMDDVVHAVAAPSSPILAVDKGKAPMVDDSLPADLLSEQERVLKNLYDYQFCEDLAKKLHAKQEAEFARQQEELAQKAQAERVASPTEHGPGLSDQRRWELDAARLIYTEADWVELLAKIATNSALSKQLLGDDVTEDNMNERLSLLLLRSWCLILVHASVPAVPSFAADVSVYVATTLEVPAAESRPADTPTASVHVSVEHSVAASTHSSSCRHHKHIAKKRVTPIVDIADAALIKFDSDSGSDDDPLPYAPYV